MDGSTTRHKINPALMSEYSYIAMPVLGDVSVGLNSNLTLENLLYTLESGQMATFLHPEADSQLFLDGIADDNMIGESLNLTILSTGFYAFGGYNTIDLSLRQNMDVNFKKSLFEFLVGEDHGTSIYDMAGTTVNANAWVETSFGHSRRINDRLTVGAKVKYLTGLANIDSKISKLEFESNEERVMLGFEATGNAAIIGVPLSGKFSEMELNELDFSNGFNGGFAVDLGATYEWDQFNFSLAVTDLGLISWGAASNLTMGTTINFDGFNDLDLGDELNESIEDEMDELYDSLDQLTDPTLDPIEGYRTYLNAKLVAGAEYDVFGDDMLSAGLLSTTTFGVVTTSELMLAATYSPTNWFDVALSGTTSTYGTYWGWAINFCPRWINFFIGMDSMVTGITPQGVPYNNSNLNLKFGLNFPFGKIHTVN